MNTRPTRLAINSMATARLTPVLFFWSSMPDNELRAAAASVFENSGRAERANRMLKDPRASALSKNFVEQWLHLRTLAKCLRTETNRAYYEDDLENAMREETAVTLHMSCSRTEVSKTLSIRIIPFSMNHRPALRNPGHLPSEFRQVQLKPEHQRGGLLGHGRY